VGDHNLSDSTRHASVQKGLARTFGVETGANVEECFDFASGSSVFDSCSESFLLRVSVTELVAR
jgi:hypothetical protein